MRAVLQVCQSAAVCIDGVVHSEIKKGLLVLLGINRADTESEAQLLATKIARLRIFPDENDRLNLNLCDPSISGDLLVVSNFTLYADCKKSRRPDFFQAANGEQAEKLYHTFLNLLRNELNVYCAEQNYPSPKISCGVFGADMKIHLINDGPITIFLDTDTL